MDHDSSSKYESSDNREELACRDIVAFCPSRQRDESSWFQILANALGATILFCILYTFSDARSRNPSRTVTFFCRSRDWRSGAGKRPRPAQDAEGEVGDPGRRRLFLAEVEVAPGLVDALRSPGAGRPGLAAQVVHQLLVSGVDAGAGDAGERIQGLEQLVLDERVLQLVPGAADTEADRAVGLGAPGPALKQEASGTPGAGAVLQLGPGDDGAQHVLGAERTARLGLAGLAGQVQLVAV